MTKVEAVRRPGGARDRVLEQALELFAVHGVSGTSLHMIADALGVTKAAVYHQFHSKEDIVLTVISPALDLLRTVVEEAEALEDTDTQRAVVVRGLIEVVVRHRTVTGVLQGDPTVRLFILDHPELADLTARLTVLLTGPEPDAAAKVRAVMLGGGIMLAAGDPLLADVDGEQLRELLLEHTARL